MSTVYTIYTCLPVELHKTSTPSELNNYTNNYKRTTIISIINTITIISNFNINSNERKTAQPTITCAPWARETKHMLSFQWEKQNICCHFSERNKTYCAKSVRETKHMLSFQWEKQNICCHVSERNKTYVAISVKRLTHCLFYTNTRCRFGYYDFVQRCHPLLSKAVKHIWMVNRWRTNRVAWRMVSRC